MEITFLLKGAFIGFTLAIPIGPIGILCIRKSLIEGHLRGLIIGFAAASTDMFYACIAVFGISIISDVISDYRIFIRILGGILLFYIGVKIFRSLPHTLSIQSNKGGITKSYFSTILLSLTNPITVFAFMAVFTFLGFGRDLSYLSASFLVLGVFIGTSLWFIILSFSTIYFRRNINLLGMQWINKVAGVLLILSGFLAIGSLL